MFKKIHRLKADKAIRLEELVSSRLFVLRFSKNARNYNRYGFVVSKKVDNRSTARNRIRRVFRSCIEELHSSQLSVLDSQRGHDMLFVLRKELTNRKRDEIFGIISKSLKERHVL